MPSDEEQSVDPITGLVVGAATNEAAKTAGGVLSRLLGPTADIYGERLRQLVVERQEAQARRILERAVTKAAGREGSVPPRVVFRVLEEGTLSDDELMAEYLSGVLAGSLSPSGRDDRAMPWSSLIAEMSSSMLRAHYVLYREWSDRLRGREDVNLGSSEGRRSAIMEMDANDYLHALHDAQNPMNGQEVMQHTLFGLQRLGLIGDNFHYGPGAQRKPEASPHAYYADFEPTSNGVELWGWAAGVPGLTTGRFVRPDAPMVGVEPDLPRLTSASFPKLPDWPRPGQA